MENIIKIKTKSQSESIAFVFTSVKIISEDNLIGLLYDLANAYYNDVPSLSQYLLRLHSVSRIEFYHCSNPADVFNLDSKLIDFLVSNLNDLDEFLHRVNVNIHAEECTRFNLNKYHLGLEYN